jgi:hypothetical protein
MMMWVAPVFSAAVESKSTHHAQVRRSAMTGGGLDGGALSVSRASNIGIMSFYLATLQVCTNPLRRAVTPWNQIGEGGGDITESENRRALPTPQASRAELLSSLGAR